MHYQYIFQGWFNETNLMKLICASQTRLTLTKFVVNNIRIYVSN